MIILDGRQLSQKILAGLKEEIIKSRRKLSLAAIIVGDDPVIAKFVAQKKKVAEELGVDFRVYEYSAEISTNELRKRIAVIVHDADPDGIIVQLPLPKHINARYILNSVPPDRDVDVLSSKALGNFFVGKSAVLPPVVGAVRSFLDEYQISVESKYFVVVGAGELVGKPVALWLLNQQATFGVVSVLTADIADFTRRADVVITGVGKSGLITGDMVKEGVVVIDAGTSVGTRLLATGDQLEASGQKMGAALAGDVDFDSVSAKAAYITPVPGGVGPLTVAMIYKNLVALSARR